MKTAVCTLYEGDYHFGVGALINSLTANGFTGDIYVGYRGMLPPWLKNSQKKNIEGWKNTSSLQLPNGSNVYFLYLDTAMHFTNYKPQFLIDLTINACKDYEALAYFDPDIVVCRNWNYFEDWMQYGVAVVHDIIMNDMPATHPLRRNWELIASNKGLTVINPIHSYINAGFCGLKKQYWEFPHLWNQLLDVAWSQFNANPAKLKTHPRPNPFFYPDQDSFNIALMTFNGSISELGPEAMGFKYGVVAMAHAVGSPKPWERNIFRSFLKSDLPKLADKKYWQYAKGLIQLYPNYLVAIFRFKLSLASFFGRFYSRN